MKKLGLLGGMSWESSIHYESLIHRQVQATLGGVHSADLIIRSVDFANIEALQAQGAWAEAGEVLAHEASTLEKAGAEAIVLCTNTMHKVADAITARLSVPFLHIADATAHAVTGAGLLRPALIATAYTMEQDFYTSRLRAAGLDVVLPNTADRQDTHRIIFEELCRGEVREPSRQAFEAIAARLVEDGADGLILGCTEVGLLLDETNVTVPVFDTTHIHCDRAMDMALS